MSKFEDSCAMAHFLEQLGDERFAALIDSANIGKVKELCDALVKSGLPTEMTIEGRSYDILGFLQEGETSVVGHTMVERAEDMSANLGQDDGKHILKHQGQIPASLRGNVVFVFTGWRRAGFSEDVYCVFWELDGWVDGLTWIGGDWGGSFRVLRRK
jgi:hypothetical protein